MSGGGLPPLLEEVVRRTVAATRLSLPDRKEVERELRAHFEDGLAAGADADQLARRFGTPEAAGRRMGEARRERARRRHEDGRWWMRAEVWWQELVRSGRTLLKSPGYAALVVATLALGVGANTAIFSVVHAVLLEDLPYPEPDRLVRVYEAEDDDPGDVNFLRAPTVAAYRTWSEIFEDVGSLYTYRERGADLTDGDRPVRITVVPVDDGYFRTLGVSPILGRGFTEEEVFPPEGAEAVSRESSVPVTILSNRLWEERFGADPGALGRTVRLDDLAHEVVGVMPPGFEPPFGPDAEAWVPVELTSQLDNWGNYWLSGVARLRDGVDLDMAQDRASALYAGLREQNPDAGDWGPRLVPLHADVVGAGRRGMLWLLASAAGLVLLTACLNVANLVLARGLRRHRDIAVRAALGSGSGRIAAGVVLENGLLALVGGGVGLALGWAGVSGLMALAPDALPRSTSPELGATVFLFALGVTVAALVAFGVGPALKLAHAPPADALRSGDRTATSGPAARRTRDGLVVAQIAAALVLVAGATLLTRSFDELLHVPLPVEPQGVLTFEVNLPVARYPDGAARQGFHEGFQQRAEALAEVEAAGAVSWLPMSGRYHIWGIYFDADDPGSWGENDQAWYSSDMRVFTEGYLASVGLGVVAGQTPAEVDLEAEPVAWISRSLADDVFVGMDPVGQQVGAAGALRRVVGVVEDVPVDARGRVTRHTYIPHAQFADDRNWSLIQTVKAERDLLEVHSELRALLAEMDPSLVLHRPRTLEAVLGAARAQDRFATVLMGAFALLALFLSLVGTYGVLAGSVAARRREIGLRMALGADGASVRGMVLRYALALVVPGVALGLVGAWLGGRWLRDLLFQVTPTDPWALAGTVAVFLTVGVAAGWLPAHRATRVDPARTLTEE